MYEVRLRFAAMRGALDLRRRFRGFLDFRTVDVLRLTLLLLVCLVTRPEPTCDRFLFRLLFGCTEVMSSKNLIADSLARSLND